MRIRKSTGADLDRIKRNLLGKLGYTRCGIIHVVEDSFPRYAFEKTKHVS